MLRERTLALWELGAARWVIAGLVACIAIAGWLAWRSQAVESTAALQVITPGSPAPVAAQQEAGQYGSAETSGASGQPSAGGLPVVTGPMGTSGSPSTGSSTGPTSGLTSGSSQVVIDVIGPVRRPGVVTLPSGSRVADAIAAAGGLTRGKTRANLARVLVDGEQIDVATPVVAPPVAGTTGLPQAAGGQSHPGSMSGKVNLNSATLDQLDMLPRVGPVTAQKIIDFRAEHGGFRSVDQLREVSGIGDRTFANLAPMVQV